MPEPRESRKSPTVPLGVAALAGVVLVATLFGMSSGVGGRTGEEGGPLRP